MVGGGGGFVRVGKGMGWVNLDRRDAFVFVLFYWAGLGLGLGLGIWGFARREYCVE